MCFLCFFEKRSQFFRATLHQISYVTIAADLVHESMASFSNETGIRATVILGDVQVTLVENPGHNIHRLFGHIQCPGGKTMTEQMRADRHTAFIQGLKNQPMHQKPQTGPDILLKQTLVVVLKEILFWLETMFVASSHGNTGKTLSGLWINLVMFTEHEFDEGKQSEVFIVQVVGCRHTFSFGNSTYGPVDLWRLIGRIRRWRDGNRDNAIRARL